MDSRTTNSGATLRWLAAISRFSSIAVEDAAGQRVDLGDAHLVQGDQTRFAVGLKPLVPGRYKVEWRVTSVDTHKTNGNFSFTVAP